MYQENNSLKTFIRQLSLINNEYCDLYDRFFKQRFFEKVDYQSFLDKLSLLKSAFDSNFAEAHVLSSAPKFDPIIYEYIENRSASIAALYHIVEKLLEKSKNSLKYSIFAYHKDMKKLERIEGQAPIIGDKMQNVATTILYD